MEIKQITVFRAVFVHFYGSEGFSSDKFYLCTILKQRKLCSVQESKKRRIPVFTAFAVRATL